MVSLQNSDTQGSPSTFLATRHWSEHFLLQREIGLRATKSCGPLLQPEALISLTTYLTIIPGLKSKLSLMIVSKSSLERGEVPYDVTEIERGSDIPIA